MLSSKTATDPIIQTGNPFIVASIPNCLIEKIQAGSRSGYSNPLEVCAKFRNGLLLTYDSLWGFVGGSLF